jgi:hypothetical protein
MSIHEAGVSQQWALADGDRKDLTV